MTIWVAILRPVDGDIAIDGMMSLIEMVRASQQLELRMRYNADIRLLTLRLPAGTSRARAVDALSLLSDTERKRLYRLPQHPIGGIRGRSARDGR